MKTIDICIQEFLTTLQHTTGPWLALPNQSDQGETIAIQTKNGSVIALVEIPFESVVKTRDANSKLINASPSMLKSICYTYLNLLVKFAYGQNSTCNKIRISLDGTLADLRNQISNATGIECERVQTVFETYVKQITA